MEVYAINIIKKMYYEKKYLLNDREYKRFIIEETGFKLWANNPRADLKIKQIRSELLNYCEEKEVKYFKFNFKEDNPFSYREGMYYVEECPINKRVWGGGRNKGKSYADYEVDCSNCTVLILMAGQVTLLEK